MNNNKNSNELVMLVNELSKFAGPRFICKNQLYFYILAMNDSKNKINKTAFIIASKIKSLEYF